MKVLQSCFSNSWGGREMETVKISGKLLEMGQNVFLAVPLNSRLQKEAEKHLDKNRIIPLGGSYFSRLRQISGLFRKEQFDVVHSHQSHDLGVLVPSLYKMQSGSRLYLTKHMASGCNKKDFIHRFLYRRISKVFAISNYIKDNVIQTCPVKSEKVYLLPNGIDLKKYSPGKFSREIIRKNLSIDNNSIVIGLIGRISPLKGHKEFIHAVDILKSKIPNAVFLVVGGASYGEEEYEREIKNLTENLGLNSQIKFLGFRENIPEILSSFDILAFPSYEESFGLTLIESMAMNIPIVAVGKAGVLDIITDNECGILVPPKDAESLASGILKLYKDKELRTKIINAGRLRVENFFSIEKVISNLLKYYSN